MATVARVIPGPDDYPGKHFIWTPEAEQRLMALDSSDIQAKVAVEILNKEFRQPVLLTTNAVIGKLNRMRGRKSSPGLLTRKKVRVR